MCTCVHMCVYIRNYLYMLRCISIYLCTCMHIHIYIRILGADTARIYFDRRQKPEQWHLEQALGHNLLASFDKSKGPCGCFCKVGVPYELQPLFWIVGPYESGHWVLYWGRIKILTKLFKRDLCPLGLQDEIHSTSDVLYPTWHARLT